MPEWSIGLIALGFVAGITAFILWRKSAKKKADAWKMPVETRAFRIMDSVTPIVTPNGHQVYFEEGADPSAFSLAACDRGIEYTNKKSECIGYPVDRSQHHNSIVVFNSIPDSLGDPAYKVYIGTLSPYYGSEWDKEAGKGEEVDHYILAAGQTVAVGEPFGDIMVIPHHSGKEAHLETVVGFEREHMDLSWYDGFKFEDTKYHLTGGHPLIEDTCGSDFLPKPAFKGLCMNATK
jgi:hypothetical protein